MPPHQSAFWKVALLFVDASVDLRAQTEKKRVHSFFPPQDGKRCINISSPTGHLLTLAIIKSYCRRYVLIILVNESNLLFYIVYCNILSQKVISDHFQHLQFTSSSTPSHLYCPFLFIVIARGEFEQFSCKFSPQLLSQLMKLRYNLTTGNESYRMGVKFQLKLWPEGRSYNNPISVWHTVDVPWEALIWEGHIRLHRQTVAETYAGALIVFRELNKLGFRG